MTRQTRMKAPPLGEAAFPPRLTKEREDALIARARSGENVRNEILLSLQRHVHAQAMRYAQNNRQVDCRDLVSAANLAILERLDTALSTQSPYGYLVGVARWTMVNCVSGREDLIKTYSSRESIPVLSLDVSIGEGEEETSFADLLPAEVHLEPFQTEIEDKASRSLSLAQAIEGLPERQRQIIQRHYGLGEHAPEPLMAISRSLSPHVKHPSRVYHDHQLGLCMLRHVLAPLFPQYGDESDQGGVQ